MDRVRADAVSQITLEDDVNIPESKPDVSTLNFDKGTVVIDEVKPGTDHVNVRGRLLFCVLYHTSEEGSSLVTLEGKIPFEEKINMQDTSNTDTVTVDCDVEDLSLSLIHIYGKKCRVLVLPEYRYLVNIFHSLTLTDNLCLKFNRKYSGAGWISRKFENFVRQSFFEWSGRKEDDPERATDHLTEQERVAVCLYRLKMQKPEVLFCNCLLYTSIIKQVSS